MRSLLGTLLVILSVSLLPAQAPGTIAVPIVAPGGVNPASGNGFTQKFEFTFTHSFGFQNLGVVNVLFNNFLDGRQACYLAYSEPQALLYLVGDDGVGLSPGLGLNSTGSIANSQCSVNSAASSATGFGNTLTLTLAITFTPSFAGGKVVYMAVQNASNGAEDGGGWFPKGAWTVPTVNPSVSTAIAGMDPGSGTGHSQKFTFTFMDSHGANDLGVVNILVNHALTGVQACYLAYVRSTNTIYLVNDNSTALLTGIPLNGSGSTGNSQCTVDGTSSSATTNGTNLTLTLNLGFSDSFSGDLIFYLAARDTAEQNNTGWQPTGAWRVQ